MSSVLIILKHSDVSKARSRRLAHGWKVGDIIKVNTIARVVTVEPLASGNRVEAPDAGAVIVNGIELKKKKKYIPALSGEGRSWRILPCSRLLVVLEAELVQLKASITCFGIENARSGDESDV